MNKSALKSYAPQARKDFIDMVTSRANALGIADSKTGLQIQPCHVQGDVAIIAGQSFPARLAGQRQRLIARIERDGFAATMEAIAYTWFNRFAALRFMELQEGFLSHGHRVLSSTTDGALPDLLTYALDIVAGGELPDISHEEVAKLKLANQDGELYKRLLIAQCNALSSVMPFLFERIDDDSELLLADNLLRTNSVVRKLVDSIDKADWQQVEIIGWLYQFYILGEKERVDEKVKKGGLVDKREIPAKTQLFTPNWIVKYLVQNSVGRLWLQANPGSTLASQMQYYIQPAEQTPEVNAQLDALIQARIAEDGDTLNPESITVLDPACGSGHILVEAYDLLKAIYLERGYRERDIPRLILEKNLFGLDIDDRAAQLAAFALLMKARSDDRRLFNEPIQLNVLALQESAGLDIEQLAQELGLADASQRQALASLLATFAQAKTFGSLLQVPSALARALPGLHASLATAHASGDLYAQSAAAMLQPLLQQAQLLAGYYDAVVANPPYLGKGMNEAVKTFAKKHFPDSKSDLFAMFIERGFGWCKLSGFNSMVTMQSWMFLSSYEAMREKLLAERTLSNMVHMGNGVMGIAFGTAATVFCNKHVNDYEGSFSYCENNDLNDAGIPNEFPVRNDRLKTAKANSFRKIPGAPISFWIGERSLDLFDKSHKLGEVSFSSNGVQTGDNGKYVRFWHEVDFTKIGFKWFGYNKGGAFRRWYGNIIHVVDWESDGERIKAEKNSCTRGESFYFKQGLTWSDVTSGQISVRYLPEGNIFDAAGPSAFFADEDLLYSTIAMMNNNFILEFSKVLNPTVHFQGGDFRKLPVIRDDLKSPLADIARRAIEVSFSDWIRREEVAEYKTDKIIESSAGCLKDSFHCFEGRCRADFDLLQRLEEENNSLFISSYGLQKELSEVVIPKYIGVDLPDREKDMQRLVSYAIGCMMGRYSLDEPGLIYAHAGNVGFDPSRYVRFAADADGIVPVSDLPWFPDDATQRVKEFLVAVWGPDTLAENLTWLADSLGRKADESPEEALRRYIATSFFKDHCQTYKKRPIYWLFSSGKQKAFEALVYLHRYNESTLARMRAEYVVPLTGKMAERIKMLQDDLDRAGTAAQKKRIEKDLEKLDKKLNELRLFDEKLRHYADLRISLDLDDGVKVNYGKFGDLLDNVKGITGGSSED